MCRFGEVTSDGSPRPGHNAGQAFPHGHRCVSSALIRPSPHAEAFSRRRDVPKRGARAVRPAPVPSTDRAIAPPPVVSTAAGGPRLGRDGDAAAPAADNGEGRVGTLRGAGVQIDGRRVGQVLVAVVLVTLAVLVVVFTVVGVHQNQQDDRLHDDGVPVTFTVSGCLGMLGGSGSNAAGYSCQGSYTLDGHRYDERLPGNDFHRPGSTVPAVAVRGDPALVATSAMARTEHSSAGVFVLPVILFAVLVVLVALVLALVRRRPRQGDETRHERGASAVT
jgi:uncharacterized membrane protein